MTIYEYNISTDFINRKLDLSSLIDTILEEYQLPLEHVVVKGEICEIYTQLDLTVDQKKELDYIIHEHTGLGNNKIVIDTVKIQEEELNVTGGQFQSYLIDIDLNTQGTLTRDISFPYNISLLSAQWIVNQNQIGDTAEFQIAPDLVVGYTTSTRTGTNVIPVDDSVVRYSKIGYWVKMNDIDLGRILSINKMNKTITVENQITSLQPSKSQIKITIKLVPYFRFTAPGSFTVGESKIGAALIPANTVLRLIYKNNSPTYNKSFGILIDYLY